MRRILREVKVTFGIWLRSRQYHDDKNYDFALVDKGFAARKDIRGDDAEILRRICVAYNKAKAVQRQVSSVYRPSNEWLPIYEGPLKEVIAALTNFDVETLSNSYGNFWRDPCSTGLVGLPLDMKKCYFGKCISRRHKMLFLNAVLYRHQLWRSLLGDEYSLAQLESPCIGNPYGYYVDGHFIQGGSDYQHYYATAIGRYLGVDAPRCVVEIGAGFGGMAYYLLRDWMDVTYIDLDLPENAALTAYYLLRAFPERNIRLFGEVDLRQQSPQRGEILIMPSFEIERLPSCCAGLVFNSYGLAEMSRETIDLFVGETTRLVASRGWFFHVNHNRTSVVLADNFGVDPKRFDRFYKIPALWNMGSDSKMDEYEYLYRRTGLV